jgi:carbon storage regulator CsrA
MAQGRTTSGLTLTRREGERIVCYLECGRELVILVKEIRPGQVRIGFRAPDSVVILREELVR